jgi:hypothetical protein
MDVTAVIKEMGKVPINALRNMRPFNEKGALPTPWNVLSAVPRCLKSMIM